MKIKTSEATGPALNWMAVVAEGDLVFRPRVGRPVDWNLAYYERGEDDRWVVRAQVKDVSWFADYVYAPSENWAQGGPIVEREEIGLRRNAPCAKGCEWEASPSITAKGAGGKWGYGPTPLIAAMRCFVASKLGDEVDVPEKLA